MNVWNTIGLRVEKKDQFLNVKFNKISETDPNKWFTVKIKLEDNHRVESKSSLFRFYRIHISLLYCCP